jgi:hypothetical protein
LREAETVRTSWPPSSELIGVRPEHLTLTPSGFEALVSATATLCERLGEVTITHLTLPDGQPVIAKLPGGQERFFATLDPAGKGNVGAGFKVYTDATSEGRGDQAILAAYAKDPNALAMLKDADPMLYKSISERLRTQMIPLPPALDKPTGTAFK